MAATGNTHRIVNTRTGTVVASRARLADSYLARTKGLLGRCGLEEGEALILPSCSMVHMFFMRFALDLIFCSRERRILALQADLRPWRISKLVFGAYSVVELPAGTLASSDLRVGDTLSW